MERDPVEQRQINGKLFTLIQRTREDPDFYCLMGRFFGSRAIAKALGMPIYDDAHRLWWLILDSEQRPVACGSLERKPQSQVAVLKSTWVEPDERDQGLYDWLFATRLQKAEQLEIQKITSTTTEKSKHTHERYGFRLVGRRGQYYLYWKKLGEAQDSTTERVRRNKTGKAVQSTEAPTREGK
jgi:N-acetylglutamate synthase-like GNAT family acetyltransferase